MQRHMKFLFLLFNDLSTEFIVHPRVSTQFLILNLLNLGGWEDIFYFCKQETNYLQRYF